MDTDIFGNDNSDALDLSDEALDARAEADLTQSEPIVEDIQEGDGKQSGDDLAPESSLSSEDDSGDPTSESEEVKSDDSDEFTIPDKLNGKSAEDIAKMYVELERRYGQEQSRELGELRKLVEAQQQQLAAMQEQGSDDEFDDITDYIRDGHSASVMYQQAIAALDAGKLTDPSVIDEIIDATHEVDPRLASKMDRDFGMRLARAEVMAHMQPVQQTSYETAVRQATNTLWNDPTLGPDAKAYNAEIVSLLKGRHLGNTQAEVAESLKQALIYVRGQDPTKSAAYRQQLEALKTDAQVEEGSAEIEPPLSIEDKVRADIFTHRKTSPADNLFAGFGGG